MTKAHLNEYALVPALLSPWHSPGLKSMLPVFCDLSHTFAE